MKEVYLRPCSRQPIPQDAKKVFDGKLFDVFQWEQEQYDGTKRTFEKVKRPDTVYILPVTDDGKIIICRQVQPGSQSYYGLLGGRVEKDENVADAAKRELQEEAGIVVNNLKLWKSFQFLPKIDWAIYIFIGNNISYESTHLDPGEKIELVYLTIDELVLLASKEHFGDVEIALCLLRTAMDQNEFESLKRNLLNS